MLRSSWLPYIPWQKYSVLMHSLNALTMRTHTRQSISIYLRVIPRHHGSDEHSSRATNVNSLGVNFCTFWHIIKVVSRMGPLQWIIHSLCDWLWNQQWSPLLSCTPHARNSHILMKMSCPEEDILPPSATDANWRYLWRKRDEYITLVY